VTVGKRRLIGIVMREKGVVGVGGLRQTTYGVTRYDEENVARCENGFWADHDTRKLEKVRSCDIVPRILVHDLRSHDWVGVYLYKASRVHQFEDVARFPMPCKRSHYLLCCVHFYYLLGRKRM